jgi:hypothetical protein
MKSMMRKLGVLAAGLTLLGVGACRDKPKTPGEGSVIQRGVPPAYADIARAYNARVEGLNRFQSSAALNVEATNQKGEVIKEQVEGPILIELPSNFSLRMTKVQKPVFYLGSNAERYWWVDLLADPKTATVGTHAKATPESTAAFGVPVHPLDLIEVLGIKPLPGADSAEAKLAKVEWSKNGRLVGVTLPGRWGTRRLWLDPSSYAPAIIELLDDREQLVVRCTISGFQPVAVSGNALLHPWAPKRLDVELPRQAAKVIISLQDVQNPGEAMRVQVFNLETVLKHYDVKKMVDIDQRQAQRAGGE